MLKKFFIAVVFTVMLFSGSICAAEQYIYSFETIYTTVKHYEIAGQYLQLPNACVVGLNRQSKELYFLAHGGETGGLRQSATTLEAVDMVLTQLVADGTLQPGDVQHITVVCCYPGCRETVQSQVLNVPIEPFCGVQNPIRCTLFEGCMIVTDHE